MVCAMMGKKANFHANFLDLTTIENKIIGFCECNKVYVSIYSSFKSCIKCFIVQTTKILPQIINSIKSLKYLPLICFIGLLQPLPVGVGVSEVLALLGVAITFIKLAKGFTFPFMNLALILLRSVTVLFVEDLVRLAVNLGGFSKAVDCFQHSTELL